MRVLTLNIWHDAGPWLARLNAIRSGLQSLNPDIVGFQEVLNLEDLQQHLRLSEGLGYDACFGKASTTRGMGEFGNAILSRWPITDELVTMLPTEEGDETRSVLRCLIDAPSGVLAVFCTHLSYRMEQGSIRTRQIEALKALVTQTGLPSVVIGDFNAASETPEMAQLKIWTDCFGQTGKGDGTTFSKSNPYAEKWNEPERRIDYVFLPDGLLIPTECKVTMNAELDGVYPSDHFGVFADIFDSRSKSKV